MYVSGMASATSDGPMRTWSARARSLPFFSVAPWRCGQELDDLGPDVVARARVLVAGIPEPHHQQVGGGAPAPQHRLLVAGVVRGAVGRCLGTTLAGFALFAFALFALDASSVATRGAATWATTKSASAWVSTPVGSEMSSTRSWSPMASARHVDLDRDRDVAGHGLDGEVEEQLLEQTAVPHAGGLTDEVDRDLGAHRDVAVGCG